MNEKLNIAGLVVVAILSVATLIYASGYFSADPGASTQWTSTPLKSHSAL